MKFWLLFLAVLALLWRWRGMRIQAPPNPPPTRPPQPSSAVPVCACSHCGLHIPMAEAVACQQGSYCCLAHRQAHEP